MIGVRMGSPLQPHMQQRTGQNWWCVPSFGMPTNRLCITMFLALPPQFLSVLNTLIYIYIYSDIFRCFICSHPNGTMDKPWNPLLHMCLQPLFKSEIGISRLPGQKDRASCHMGSCLQRDHGKILQGPSSKLRGMMRVYTPV